MKRSTARWIKQGDLVSDYVGGGMSDALMGSIAGSLGNDTARSWMNGARGGINAGGTVYGLTAGKPTIADIKELDKNPAVGFVPGVARARLWLRRRAIRNLLNEEKKDTPRSEFWGPAGNLAVSGLAGAGLGAGLGAYLGKKDRLGSAVAGGVLGGFGGMLTSMFGNGLGALGAAFTRRRTLDEQYDYENNKNNWVQHLLVPGTAAYDFHKGLGASKYITEMSEDDLNKEVARIRKARGIK